MNSFRRSFTSALFLMVANMVLSAEPQKSSKVRSIDQVIREEFKFQGVIHESEAPPVFARVKVDGEKGEVIRLPNYVVRELPDQTRREVDDAIATRDRLGSGAAVKKNLTKRTHLEAILPLSLDRNVAGERVLRFDVLRLGW
jgi:hypothetical protein